MNAGAAKSALRRACNAWGGGGKRDHRRRQEARVHLEDAIRAGILYTDQADNARALSPLLR